jgi:general secretion pathway protein L
VLLVTQVLAINAMAWSEKSLLEQKRKQQHAILQSTFPLVRVVLDAPLQMQREVALLAQSRGGIAEIEFVQVLMAVQAHAPAGAEVSAIELTAHQMRLQATGWGAPEVSALNGALAAQGLAAHATDGFIIVQHTGTL